jgi:hypothetical protein
MLPQFLRVLPVGEKTNNMNTVRQDPAVNGGMFCQNTLVQS